MSHDPYATLRIRDFRLFLLARLLMTSAILVQSVAVGWLVYQVTHDPLSLGLIGLAEAIPAIGVALYAGHVADRANRRRIILICLSLLALASGGLLLWVQAPVWLGQTWDYRLIYLLIMMTGLARGFLSPALFGLQSQIVPRELYRNGATWSSSTFHTASVLGPALGGLLFGFLGAGVTFAVDVLLLGAAITCIGLVPKRPKPQANPHLSVYDSIVEGLRFVFRNQIFVGALALDLFAVFFGGAVALLPMFADQVLGVGPQGLGLMRAAPALGAVLMALVIAHWPIRRCMGSWMLWAVAAYGICIITFALSTHLYLSVALLALSGAVDNISVVIRSTILQTLTPDSMRGRVSAVNSIFIGSSNEIGEFESGVMARLMGLVPSVVFGGCMTLLVVCLTKLSAPKLANLDSVE